jgi:glycosyltransferase involved in cell wall biosynthesis
MAIPKVIHQLWKDAAVPERYRSLVDSWSRHNPGWERRLWTDRDLLDLVEQRYPDWLATYLGYQHNINRADLGRYLVLREFGGVYVDLDCECLQPIDPLLAGATLAIGVEPAEHVAQLPLDEPGFEQFLCASFIASTPYHPYWDAVLAEARASVGETAVLFQTGPFVLTRAYRDFPDKASVRLLPEALVYPLSKYDCWEGLHNDIEFWERKTRGAYVAHFWDGTWFRSAPLPGGLPFDIPTTTNAVAPVGRLEPAPRISCLTPSRGRLGGVRPAIEAYLRQTYANRELVIAAAAPEADLVDYVRALGRDDLRLIVLPDRPAAASNGPLDPALIAAASGETVCAWAEDVRHDPRRLEVQQQIRLGTESRACLMRRRLIWQPRTGRLGVGAARPLAGSVLADKADLLALAEAAAGETAWLQALAAKVRTAAFDLPRLMLWIDDGQTMAAAAAFEADWQAASTRFDPERTGPVLDELARRLDVTAAPRARRDPASPGPPAASLKVLVLTPVKNARPHLRAYVTLADRIEAGGARLSIGLLESDSSDGTYEALIAAEAALHRRFESVTLLRHDFGFHVTGHRAARDIQRRRREIIARSRNRLLAGALRDEDWVLWLDADLADYPADLLTRLLGAGHDIVTPHCVRPDGTPFDLNTFCFSPQSGGRDDPRHLHDGLFQPPRGEGRLYLDAFEGRDLVEVDSVGGTALLVRADLHREGLNFPPYSYRGYIETEGLAMMARDMGQSCWAMPQLRITHADT